MKFDISKCELIRKPSSSKNWLNFCIFFAVDRKITFGYNFGARLRTIVAWIYWKLPQNLLTERKFHSEQLSIT